MLELPSELVNLLGSQSGSAKKKKSVTFADDCGSQLVTIQIIAEPSDVPPQIRSEIVHALLATHEQLPGDNGTEMAAEWIVNFEQPCSNHSSFRRNLNQRNVALENAVLQSDYHRLQGTVRVKNLAFEKEVFIRHTSDGWKTYQDLQANFLRSTGREYDTFVFYLPTPAVASKEKQKIEFCVCYRTKNQEFWDSNENKNYEIISDHLRKKRMQSPAYVHNSMNGSARPNHASGMYSKCISKCYTTTSMSMNVQNLRFGIKFCRNVNTGETKRASY
ncbi:CBM 21 domain containing protein [Trichuris trichiura]|uniref:CBM 21 domain containing protein n=1 Tax=Trichuris trichiura TaxID=36087 RepID=A0A077YZ54_TRITR|nr:CBM 21 domain containing protein [Trichuris trichiura]